MKIKINSKTKVNLAIPGKPMTQQEFEAMIKESEKGQFFSHDEVLKRIESWKEKYKE